MSDGFSILAVANKAHDFIGSTRRGMLLLKLTGYLRDRQGILKMGRGLSGILAGYLNYWRPNLPLS